MDGEGVKFKEERCVFLLKKGIRDANLDKDVDSGNHKIKGGNVDYKGGGHV